MFELILAVSIVVIASAMCSLFEAVLYSVPISHIESLAEQGKPSGSILRGLRNEIDRPIAAILSLNTIANTAGAALAGAIAVKVLGQVWIGVFSAVFTLAILFISEIIPKTTGVIFARQLSSWIARPLQMLIWAMSPLVWVSRLLTGIISSGKQSGAVSEEELLMMIKLGGQTGTIGSDEAGAIMNIIGLKSKSARDVMTPRTVVHSISGATTVGDVRQEAAKWEHGRIPVYENEVERIVGIVHRRTVLGKAIAGDLDARMDSLMHPPHFVDDSMPLDELLSSFLERRVHLFVVLGEFGGLAGVVTLEDVLEEALGQEIVDEFDEIVDMRELARQRREETVKRLHDRQNIRS